MKEVLKVGTRRSPLALAQTAIVLQALRRDHPDSTFLVVPFTTAGDRRRIPGGSPDFTDRISAALESGEVDLAVHAANDLPPRAQRAVRVAAFVRRDDPSEVLVGRRGAVVPRLPADVRIGSSSRRSRAQLLREWPGTTVVDVGGRVEARLALLDAGELDAVVLEAAGLTRLGLADRIGRRLPIRRFLPSPGQGTLAVEVRYGDRALDRVVRGLDHGPTRAAATAERTCAAAFGVDGKYPLAVLGTVRGESMRLEAELLDPDGLRSVRVRRTGPVMNAGSLGRLAGSELLRAAESGGRVGPP
ncbi:MAG: hydroxymethylbilane synthase [Thermoplasmata archaeon]|nr:hydroxymethylbilane synthase [Thermoplasmata archaeon]